MQHVQRGPRALAAADGLHLWLVLRSPGIGKCQPIHAGRAQLASDLHTLAGDARSPVDAGAKDIEDKCLWLGFHEHPATEPTTRAVSPQASARRIRTAIMRLSIKGDLLFNERA